MFHMLPDMLPRLITQFSSSIGGAVLLESSLSFLGLGFSSDTQLGHDAERGTAVCSELSVYCYCPGCGAPDYGVGVWTLLGDGLN